MYICIHWYPTGTTSHHLQPKRLNTEHQQRDQHSTNDNTPHPTLPCRGAWYNVIICSGATNGVRSSENLGPRGCIYIYIRCFIAFLPQHAGKIQVWTPRIAAYRMPRGDAQGRWFCGVLPPNIEVAVAWQKISRKTCCLGYSNCYCTKI